MRKNLLKIGLSLLIMMLFPFKMLDAQTNVPYWKESFTTGPGLCNLSTSIPTSNTTYYFQGANSGTWWGKNIYNTTGTGCPSGNPHVRAKNISGVTDSAVLVTPIVDYGIKELHFSRARASRPYTIFYTNDTAAQTTNWTLVANLPSLAGTITCTDTTILINSATAKRVKIRMNSGIDTDIDSVWLTNFTAGPTSIAANVTVGAGGTYPSFTNAGGLFEAINNGVVNQNVTATVISNTNELGTHQLNQFTAGYTLKIEPDAATLRVIEMSNPTLKRDTLFLFNGADNITIDGSFNGSGRYLLFRNIANNRDSAGIVFCFNNGAKFNSIKNSILESNASNVNAPVVYLNANNLTQGNTNATFYGNLWRASTGVYAGGFSTGIQSSTGFVAPTTYIKNSNLLIRKNEITGFHSTNSIRALYCPANIDSVTIDSNFIYADPTKNDNGNIELISLSNVSTLTISNNSIGGTNKDRSGSAFTSNNSIFPIIVYAGDTLKHANIFGNIISNFGGRPNSNYPSFNGIYIRGSNLSVYNNIIGGGQNPYDTIQASGVMISFQPEGGYNGNTIANLYGNTVSHINYTGKKYAVLYGLQVTRGGAQWNEANCYNNIISDMYSNSVATNNAIPCLLGIYIQNNTQGPTYRCYNNVIKNLTHSADTNRYLNQFKLAGNVVGIQVNGYGLNTVVYKNKISGLSASNYNAADTGVFSTLVMGINVEAITNRADIYNNQISLHSNSGSAVRYIGIRSSATSNNTMVNAIHNSIYLGGISGANGVNGVSSVILKELKGGFYLRNNILVNALSGPNTNVNIHIDSLNANWKTDTSSQNNLFVSVNANQMGLWLDRTNPINLSTWKTAASADSTSAYYTSATLAPTNLFTNPSLGDLTIKTATRNYVVGKGLPEPSFGLDYSDNTRSSTAPTLGAFEYSLAPALAPTVITTSRTSITTTSATLAGNATDSGTSTITERGVVYATSTNPTTANTKIAIGSGLGTYSQNVTGLTPNTLYHVRAYAINNVGTSYGFDSTFTTLSLSETYPTVITSKPSLIGVYSALLGGSVVDSGSSSIIERGVVYATTLNPTTANNKNVFASSAVVAKIITGLTPNTLYHVRYYAINSTGISYGGDSTFTTLSIPTLAPSVITLKTTSIGITNATLSGNVTDSGTNIVTERGVVYATTADPTTTDTKIIIGSGLGAFSQNVTGLLPSTTYHVRAYAINSVGTSYGADSLFTTLSAIAPSVLTTSISSIGITNATLSGNVTDSGTNAVTERGVVYATTINPTTANTKVVMGSGLGNFSQNITGLLPLTTYHVRAYAINSAGISYGADSIFTTLPAPTVANVITGNVTNISNTSASLAGNVVADGGASVTERGIVLATTANPTTANTKVTIGSGLGNFSQIITALTPNTTYHYKAYAINSVGTSYGADSIFTTLPNPEFNKNITNAFSPDGNGTNDTWVIDNADLLDGHEITVYNIFGQVVYSQTGYNTPWDGKKDGDLVPSGEYYYHIKGSKINIKGALLIKTNQ